jgi:hypothetical protein
MEFHIIWLTFELTGWAPQAASPSTTQWCDVERIVMLHLHCQISDGFDSE